MEEDPSNKSELLLKYNPVHKRVPLLLHGSKPIAESLIILEHIEETWPDYPLLPTDPYEKAIARFWIQFLLDMAPVFGAFILSTCGEEQKKAIRDLLEVLKTIEEQALGKRKVFGGDAINLVDISYGMLAYWFKIVEEVMGLKLLEPTTLPRLCQWAQNFIEVPLIKETIPDHDKIFARLKEKIAALQLNKQLTYF